MNVTAQAGDTLFRRGSEDDHTVAAKVALRCSLRQARKQVPHSERRRAARTAASRLMRSGLLRRRRRIGIYLSYGSELSTVALRTALLRQGFDVFTAALTKRGLLFRRLAARGLHSHALGMQQMRHGRAHAACSMDLIVLPLLGFDPRGMRLGQGGGYYDRALQRCRQRPLRLGFAYAVQEVEHLPSERWDVPLHAVQTERKLHRFHR